MAAAIPSNLPRQLSERLAELSTSADGESGVIDVPVEIMIELPLEDLQRMGIDAGAIFSEQAGAAGGRAGYTVTGTRSVQLLLAQLLRGGLLESALAEFMNDIINTSFLDAEPDFTPAAEQDIRNLPVFMVTQELLANEAVSKEMKTCPICCDPFAEGLRVMRLPCRHLFCEECLRPWLEKSRTCPLCREEIANILPSGEKQPAQGFPLETMESSQGLDRLSDRASAMPSTMLSAPAVHFPWHPVPFALDVYATPFDAAAPSFSYYDPAPYLGGQAQVPGTYLYSGQYGGITLPSVMAQPPLHFPPSPPLAFPSALYSSFLVLDPYSSAVPHQYF
eukprot:GGOE01021491.1.p1 GENE.GGOE01021491.1~~GGOE01021491.1.p1  ORF type:complete len:342 (+),score=90.14 GGOE01021491.1:22-1026(+)